MNTGDSRQENERGNPIGNAIRRILGFKALRTMRTMVNEIEQEEAADKKTLRILLIMLPVIMILAAALFLWFRHSVSIQQF